MRGRGEIFILNYFINHTRKSEFYRCASAGTSTAVYPDEMDKGATSNHIGIGKMLIMWKRSVYKVVYQEMVVFLILFGILSAVYRNALNAEQKKLSN